MGKYIILVTFAVALGVMLLAQQGMQTDLDTSKSQSTRQKQVLARQIARSAFERAVSELRRDAQNGRDLRIDGATGEPIEYEGGSFTLEDSGSPKGPVVVTATGSYDDQEYQVSGTIDFEVPSTFNSITSQGSANFNPPGGSDSINCQGTGTCISGKDKNGDRHGISLSPNRDTSDVLNKFDGDIKGVNGSNDVISRKGGRDSRNKKVNESIEELEKDIGNSEDVTVCESGGGGPDNPNPPGNPGRGSNLNLGGAGPLVSSIAFHPGGPPGGPQVDIQNRPASFSPEGSSTPPGNCRIGPSPNDDNEGVLYVKGDLTINGGATWEGLVFLNEGASVTINGGGTGPFKSHWNIHGSLIMQDNTEFSVNGGQGNFVRYSSESVKNVIREGYLPSQVMMNVGDKSRGFEE